KRIHERPINQLVQALRLLGADITYTGKEDFAPLLIKGQSQLKGGEVAIDSSISSQFISALMLIAPHYKEGIKINIINSMVSESFITMTKTMMEEFGIHIEIENNSIIIPRTDYTSGTIFIESDYASASYWYSLLVLMPNDYSLSFTGLKQDSIQPDRKVTQIYSKLGIETIYNHNVTILHKINNFVNPTSLEFDLTDAPDLAQTIACTCAALDIDLELNGLQTLVYKETNRLVALKTELEKFGKKVEIIQLNSLKISGIFKTGLRMSIPTYMDHRMAMSFAPLCVKCESIIIEDSEVVCKSYPMFWEELSNFATITKLK
ncbi:MAG: 3-phosphoshikimate 1-carboxyvinyltransferase, partial [Saprospiraceae bacterium]